MKKQYDTHTLQHTSAASVEFQLLSNRSGGEATIFCVFVVHGLFPARVESRHQIQPCSAHTSTNLLPILF